MADLEAARRFLAGHFEDAGLPHVAGAILDGASPFGQGAYLAAVAEALNAPPDPTNQDDRDRFEEWAHAQSYRGGNIMADRDAAHADMYADPVAQLTWKSWQAALSSRHTHDEHFLSGLCNRLATLSATAQRMAEGGNSTLRVVGLHHAQQMVRRAGSSGRPITDLHRLVPPLWLSDQIGGVVDDLTAGQAWRSGFNECRTRMQLLVDQALDLHQVEASS